MTVDKYKEYAEKVLRALDEAGLAVSESITGQFFIVKKVGAPTTPVTEAVDKSEPHHDQKPGPTSNWEFGGEDEHDPAPDAEKIYRTERFVKEYNSRTAGAALGIKHYTVAAMAANGIIKNARKRAGGQWRFDADYIDSLKPADVADLKNQLNDINAHKYPSKNRTPQGTPPKASNATGPNSTRYADVYITKELSDMFGRHTSSYSAAAKLGLLPAYQVVKGGPWYFPKKEIDAMSRQEINEAAQLAEAERHDGYLNYGSIREARKPDIPDNDLKEPKLKTMNGESAWSLAQAAQLLGVTPGQLKRQIQRGNVRAEPMGDGSYIVPAKVVELVLKRRQEPRRGRRSG